MSRRGRRTPRAPTPRPADEAHCDLEAEYRAVAPLLSVAKSELTRRIEETLAELADPYLIRARMDRPRIKSLPSIKRKARRWKWKTSEAMAKLPDLVGHRVVCNNLQGVRRAAALLVEALGREGIPVTVKDRVEKPTPEGYRAIHLEVRLPIRVASRELEVRCEIQVRSLLQEVWGVLACEDMYAADRKVPKRLLKQM